MLAGEPRVVTSAYEKRGLEPEYLKKEVGKEPDPGSWCLQLHAW